jgi:hypothetical protein
MSESNYILAKYNSLDKEPGGHEQEFRVAFLLQ